MVAAFASCVLGQGLPSQPDTAPAASVAEAEARGAKWDKGHTHTESSNN